MSALQEEEARELVAAANLMLESEQRTFKAAEEETGERLLAANRDYEAKLQTV
jgi:hypothetical protein